MTRKTKGTGKNKQGKIGVKVSLLVILSLFMPTAAGVIISLKEISDPATIYLVQFLAITTGCILALLWAALSSFTFRALGFRGFKVGKWLFGILLIESVALLGSINFSIDLKELVWLGLFMLAVGIFEELIYRGLILNYLQKNSREKAVMVSAGLFGIGHLVNVLGGAAIGLTLAQILFAGLFGIVTAELVMLTRSMLPVMIWHASHNILSSLTSSAMTVELIVVGIQCVLLTLMAILLWRKLFFKSDSVK